MIRVADLDRSSQARYRTVRAGCGPASAAIALLGLALLTPAASAPAGQTLRIDGVTSHASFALRYFGFWTLSGQFPTVAGTVVVSSPEGKASALDAEIRVASLVAEPRTWTQRLLGPEVFDSARFPTMHFRSDVITYTTATTAKIDGLLTIHGIAQPTTFYARFAVNPRADGHPPMVKATATASIRRSAFHISSLGLFAGDNVDIAITIQASQPVVAERHSGDSRQQDSEGFACREVDRCCGRMPNGLGRVGDWRAAGHSAPRSLAGGLPAA